MKRRRILIVLMVVVFLLATACTSALPEPTPVPTPTPEPTMSPEEVAAEQARIEAEIEAQRHLEKENRVKDLKMVLLVPGTLEDASYKTAYEGLERVQAEYGTTVSYIELGTNTKTWEKQFSTMLEEDWDVIITMDNASSDKVSKMVIENASAYPEKRFILFPMFNIDAPENVVTVKYNTNEGSFLVGACAALVTTSSMALANEQPLIGFIGGMDMYPINNLFLVGYIEGAKYINPDIKMMVSYANSFNKKSTGEKLAAKQYAKDVDIIFQVAGETGNGVINGAAAADRYVIGVDSDQALMLEAEYPEKAAHILTSMMSKADGAIFWLINTYAADELEFGRSYYLGVAEDAVGIVKNSYYDQMSPEIKAQIEDVEEKIISEEINVDQLEGMDGDSIQNLVDSLAP